jgi:hypothetical protein
MCEVGRFVSPLLAECGVRSVQRHTRTVASPQGALPTRIRCLTGDGLGGSSGQQSTVGRRSVALSRRKRDSHCWLRDSAASCRRWNVQLWATSGVSAVKRWLNPTPEALQQCPTTDQFGAYGRLPRTAGIRSSSGAFHASIRSRARCRRTTSHCLTRAGACGRTTSRCGGASPAGPGIPDRHRRDT